MKLLLTLCLCCFTLAVQGQFTNDTLLNVAVHELNGSEQSVPLTATTADGKTYISWFDNSSGQYVLRMQLLSVSGTALWTPGGIVVSSFPQNSALYRYDIEVDRDNNAIVAFQDERTGTLQVVAYKITATGQSAWGNGIVLQDSTSGGLSPRLTVTGNNDVIVAWNASIGSSKWVAYARITGSGQLQWIKRIWNNQKYSRGVLLPASTSGFQMLYVQETGSFPGGASTMYLQRFDSSGTGQWASPVQVSSKTISFFFFPEIISDGNDGIYIAFNTGNPANPSLNDVYAQHIDSAGQSWSVTGTQCATSATDQKLTGGFCTDSTGQALLVALQILNGSQSSSGISLQRLDATGNRMLGSNAVSLRPVSANYYLPVGIVRLGVGVMIPYLLGGFGNQMLYGLFCDPNGLPLLGYDPTISGAPSNKQDVNCGPYRNGQTVLVWEDDRVDGGIYTQNIQGNGMFIPVGLPETTAGFSAMIFPNPNAQSKLSVQSAQANIAEMVVEQHTGAVVYRSTVLLTAGRTEIELPQNLPAGMYLVRLQTESKAGWQGKWIHP